MPFYFSKANSAGTRLNSGDTLISPAPTYVTYPAEALGQILETADGIPVHQQMNKDGRVRKWTWVGYRDNVPGYQALWNNLLSLRARHLKEAGAVTPYVYLKETDTKRLRRRYSLKGTATSGGASSLTHTGAFTGLSLGGYILYLIDKQGAGQHATIVSNDNNTITISGTWSINPNSTTKYEVVGWVDDWFECRVLDVSRVVDDMPTNPPTYKETTLTFVIDDSSYNDLG